jgi:hypothetical protein
MRLRRIYTPREHLPPPSHAPNSEFSCKLFAKWGRLIIKIGIKRLRKDERGGKRDEKDDLRDSCSPCRVSRQPHVRLRGTEARFRWRTYQDGSSGLAWSSSAMETSRPQISILAERHSGVRVMVPVGPLCSPTADYSAGNPCVCPTRAGGTVLLVLLPGSARVLPLRQDLPGRLDEGGSGRDAAPTVEEVIAQ